jgi:RND family efflux transporter MFP subunit
VFSPARNTLLLIPFLISACGENNGATLHTANATPNASNFITIQTTEVEEVLLKEPIVATGTTFALKTTDIKPMVSGLVEEVYVGVGDRVTKGQPLIKIRQTEINLRIVQLGHRIALARSELKNALQDVNTNVGLRKSGVISKEVVDDTQTRYDIARARLGIAETQLLEAKQNLEDSISKAPFDGVITIANVQEGAFVSNMSMSMGGPGGGSTGDNVLQVQQIDVIVAMVRLPEVELSRISVGTPALITIDGLDQSFDSQIHVINDLVDFQSRTIDVRLGIKNENYLIKPGLFIRVKIFPKPQNRLIAARQAVLGSTSHHVFINQNGVARKVPVTIRELDTERVEITSGVQSGQFLLLGNNLTRIQDGAPIVVKEV